MTMFVLKQGNPFHDFGPILTTSSYEDDFSVFVTSRRGACRSAMDQ